MRELLNIELTQFLLTHSSPSCRAPIKATTAFPPFERTRTRLSYNRPMFTHGHHEYVPAEPSQSGAPRDRRCMPVKGATTRVWLPERRQVPQTIFANARLPCS